MKFKDMIDRCPRCLTKYIEAPFCLSRTDNEHLFVQLAVNVKRGNNLQVNATKR